MMDLVDFGPLHILMRDDNSRISMLVRIPRAVHSARDSSCSKRDLSVDSDQLRPLGSAYLSQERVTPMESAARDDYGPVAKTLHWVTVLLVIIAWSLGMFGEELSEESA